MKTAQREYGESLDRTTQNYRITLQYRFNEIPLRNTSTERL